MPSELSSASPGDSNLAALAPCLQHCQTSQAELETFVEVDLVGVFWGLVLANFWSVKLEYTTL
eukprot:6019574-Amphidinium_carterae.1